MSFFSSAPAQVKQPVVTPAAEVEKATPIPEDADSGVAATADDSEKRRRALSSTDADSLFLSQPSSQILNSNDSIWKDIS